MRNFLLLLLITLKTIFFGQSLNTNSPPKTADEVLQTLSNKLNLIERVNYTYYRDVNYVSESYHSEISGSTYLDFKSSQNVLGFRFQIENDIYKHIFDGDKSIFLDKKKKTMKIVKQPQIDEFSSLSFFVNSVVTLKSALPVIILDKKITKKLSDTTLNNKNCFVVSFIVKNKVMNNLGAFRDLTSQRDIAYRIFVDKSDFLPSQIVQTNSVEPKDYVLTRFSDYKINAYSPSENTWFYLTYATDYKPIFKN